MATRQRKGVMIQVQAPGDTKARLVELAAANGRSLSDEVLHAIDRHLAAPPQLLTPSHTPPTPTEGEK